MGFAVKLDTNGSNPKMLKELADSRLIDYVAMDIKSAQGNPAYKKLMTEGITLENMKEIAKNNPDLFEIIDLDELPLTCELFFLVFLELNESLKQT